MKKAFCVLLAVLPTVCSVASMFRFRCILIAAAVVLLFAAVAILPQARHRENVWMFVLALPVTIPINLMLLFRFYGYFESDYMLNNVLCVILFFGMAVSMEEVALGIVTRRIWRKQYSWPQAE